MDDTGGGGEGGAEAVEYNDPVIRDWGEIQFGKLTLNESLYFWQNLVGWIFGSLFIVVYSLFEVFEIWFIENYEKTSKNPKKQHFPGELGNIPMFRAPRFPKP